MNPPLRGRLLGPVLLLLLTAGCNGTTSGSGQAAPDGTPSPTVSVAPTPTFADLTQGNVQSPARLRAYDAKNKSVVLEPIIFMNGAAYCAKYGGDPLDADCQREWVTEDSRTRVTMPLADDPEFFTWEGGEDGSVCLDAPAGGGTCPMTARAFAAWAENSAGEMLAVTAVHGEITRVALIYTP